MAWRMAAVSSTGSGVEGARRARTCLGKYEEHFSFDPRAPPPAIAAATTQVEELEAALENMQAKHAISVAIQDATHGSSCDSERAQGRRHAHLDRLLSAIITSEEHKCKWHAVGEGMLEQARQLWKTSIMTVDYRRTSNGHILARARPPWSGHQVRRAGHS